MCLIASERASVDARLLPAGIGFHGFAPKCRIYASSELQPATSDRLKGIEMEKTGGKVGLFFYARVRDCIESHGWRNSGDEMGRPEQRKVRICVRGPATYEQKRCGPI